MSLVLNVLNVLLTVAILEFNGHREELVNLCEQLIDLILGYIGSGCLLQYHFKPYFRLRRGG